MTLRAFVAIPLPSAARRALVAAREAFIDASPDWAGEKWVSAENLHVTLKFLGAIEDAAVPAVLAAVAEACAAERPFALTLGDVVGRPSGRARMLWARVADGVEPARRLQSAIDDALAPLLGLEGEERVYTPHVTLARLRRPRHVPRAALGAANATLHPLVPSCGGDALPEPATVVSVRGVSVVSSETLREGPVYRELAFVPLADRD